MLTDLPASEVRAQLRTIIDDIWKHFSFDIGGKSKTRVDYPLFDDPTWKHKAMAWLKQMARDQLDTIGSGNHYVDLLGDEPGRTWLMMVIP